MSKVTILCPHCGLSKDLPADKVPDVRISVNCPRCRGSFDFTKPEELTKKTTETPDVPRSAASCGQPPPSFQQSPQPPRQQTPRSPHPGTNGELTGISDLFTDAWTIFRQRFGTLFPLYLLTVVFFLIPIAVIAGAGYLLAQSMPGSREYLVPLSVILGSVAGFLGMFLGFGAFIAAITDETLKIRESLSRGKLKLFPFLWVCTLAGFIVTGSFLLLIIPGIIFSIWFFFAQFIIMDDDSRGMDALLKSKEYVRGHWFDVFLRIMLIWAASMVVGMVPVAGPILSILAVPYVMVFYFLIYRDLKRVKGGDIMYSCSTRDKAKWLAAGTLGYIAVPVIIIALFGASVTSTFFMLKSIMDNKGQTIVIPPPDEEEEYENPQPLQPVKQDMPRTAEVEPV